jgi:hypothetical protein
MTRSGWIAYKKSIPVNSFKINYLEYFLGSAAAHFKGVQGARRGVG